MNSRNWKAVYAASPRIRPGTGREPWRLYLLAALTAFALSFGLRCLEIPFWENPEYRLNGEWLLATHDAYHWIAGADGFEFGAGHPMSELVRLTSLITGSSYANAGFWLPLFLGSLLSMAVCAWGVAYRMPWAGMVAGVLTACAPGFLSRTLLGYCDTDLVILLFGCVLGFIPAVWLLPWLERPIDWLKREGGRSWWIIRAGGMKDLWQTVSRALAGGRIAASSISSCRRLILARSLSPFWLSLLMVGGLFGHWTQEWHSYFPYAVRFTAGLVPILILVLGPWGGRRLLLAAALVFCLPLLAGWPGLVPAIAMTVLVLRLRQRRLGTAFPPTLSGKVGRVVDRASEHLEQAGSAPKGWANFLPWLVPVLWLVIVLLLADGEVWAKMLRSVGSYLKTGSESGHSLAADPVIFPAVARSIIEVQNLSFSQMLMYFHPLAPVALAGFVGCICLFFLLPGTLFLGLMFTIAVSSLQLGGRMAMFTAPVFALGLCLGGRIFLLWLFSRKRAFAHRLARLRPLFLRLQTVPSRILCGAAVALVLLGPVAAEIPFLSSGPILSRDQAAALSFLKASTPEDSVVWNWWDYGYATHHFSRRHTVSDGARHGGPSLFVPAAVYTTADPYFAGQLMAYTSQAGGTPGDVFRGITGAEADQLMADLESGKLAPVASSKQYLVVSFELIPLGYWISTYGNWDFGDKTSEGYFISSISNSLQYNLETGVVLVRGFPPAYAASIDAFERDGLQHQSYFRQDPSAMHFLFNAVTGEAYSVKSDFYNMLMCQLLVSPPDDSRFAQHFSLVYANPTVKIYELLQDRPEVENAQAQTPPLMGGGRVTVSGRGPAAPETNGSGLTVNGSAVGMAEPEPVREALVEEAVRQGLVNATEREVRSVVNGTAPESESHDPAGNATQPASGL